MIIWIASYPKSGNTLVRAILSSLIYSENGNFNFNLLNKIDQYPQKKHFDGLTNKYGDLIELSKNWIFSQNRLNLNKKIKYLKTHHLNCTINKKNYFTNENNTLGVIYIVRDPRDVLVSYARHSINSIKNTLLDMTTSDNCIFTNKNLVNLLGSWSDHYNSWKRINKNFLLIKYEDLIENKKKEMLKILNFVNIFVKIPIDETKVEKCLNSTTFENMKNMEEKGFFEEQAIDEKTGKKINFFHKGKNNQWKDFLDTSTIKKIEENFETEMKELKYI